MSSVCLSVCNSSRTAEEIFIKFYIDGVLLKFVHSVQFGWNRSITMGNSHRDIYAFLIKEVNELEILESGISCQPLNHMGNPPGLRHHLTRQAPAIPSAHR